MPNSAPVFQGFFFSGGGREFTFTGHEGKETLISSGALKATEYLFKKGVGGVGLDSVYKTGFMMQPQSACS